MASRAAANAGRPIIVKMIVNAGQAAPSPPVGPALGSKGVKAIDFCKQFNAITGNLEVGLPIPTIVKIRPADRSFTFSTTSPQSSFLILRCAGATKGATSYDGQWALSTSATSQGQPVGTITLKHIYELAKIKSDDPQLAATSLKNICRMLIGTANSVGVKVVA